ncbi:MAG: GNAT family N-acetyltransferase [Sphingomonadaceae bacterium]|nr:GNAT family N-acetyltransferase [Sphingomonadaceae bacterium]
MSEDALRELAENRGCKLVKSRIRTPGRGDYGRFGLKDGKSGREVFGFGGKGLTASAEEIEAFLRGNVAATWKSSVGSAKRAAPKAKPKPAPKPKPEPKLVLRDAKPGDAEAIAALIAALGYEASAADVRRRMAALGKAGQQILVAEKGDVVGVLTTSIMTVLHRPKPVGRISMMVVAEKMRGAGIGGALVAEAEKRLAAQGCGLVEVTSNIKRLRAHGFYEKLGYERTSYRFAKALDTPSS